MQRKQINPPQHACPPLPAELLVHPPDRVEAPPSVRAVGGGWTAAGVGRRVSWPSGVPTHRGTACAATSPAACWAATPGTGGSPARKANGERRSGSCATWRCPAVAGGRSAGTHGLSRSGWEPGTAASSSAALAPARKLARRQLMRCWGSAKGMASGGRSRRAGAFRTEAWWWQGAGCAAAPRRCRSAAAMGRSATSRVRTLAASAAACTGACMPPSCLRGGGCSAAALTPFSADWRSACRRSSPPPGSVAVTGPSSSSGVSGTCSDRQQ